MHRPLGWECGYEDVEATARLGLCRSARDSQILPRAHGGGGGEGQKQAGVWGAVGTSVPEGERPPFLLQVLSSDCVPGPVSLRSTEAPRTHSPQSSAALGGERSGEPSLRRWQLNPTLKKPSPHFLKAKTERLSQQRPGDRFRGQSWSRHQECYLKPFKF